MTALLAVGLNISASLAAGTSYKWAGQEATDTTWSGMDGYIRASATVMADSTNNAHGPWFSMGPSGQWAQIGAYQGTSGIGVCPGSTCIRSRTSIHMFAESTDLCGSYGIADFGAPPTANYPYYVNFDGALVTTPCGMQYEWAYRVGSFSNPPVRFSFMSVSTSSPQSYEEVAWLNTPEAVNWSYIGLDNSQQINDSYGIHLYRPGFGWYLWNNANVSGSSSGTPSDPPQTPLVYVQIKAWSAYDTHQ